MKEGPGLQTEIEGLLKVYQGHGAVGNAPKIFRKASKEP